MADGSQSHSSEHMVQRARQLRRGMTGPEHILWNELRGRRFGDWKFRRQVPLGPFVVDFLCRPIRLIIELDGESHIGRFAQDRAREAWLRDRGYSVMRFSNDEIVKELEYVLTAIERILLAR